MKNNSAQPDNPLFFRQLDTCCKKIAIKFGGEDILEWKNSDYSRLSRQIFAKTKVRLSPETLKRIFGKVKTPSRYYPQTATRDALAQYLDYRDWYEYEIMNTVQKEHENLETKIEQMQPNAQLPVGYKPERKHYAYRLYILVFILLAFAGLYFFLSEHQNSDDVKLICINPEGTSPHSAIFKLNLIGKANVPSGFTIDFGDGKARKNIAPGEIVTHYYEYPSRFFATLLYKGKVQDTANVYLKSNGWNIQAEVPADTLKNHQIDKTIEQNGVFNVNTEQVASVGIDTNKTFLVSFINMRATEISGDNMQLTAYIKTSLSRQGIRCSQVDLIIYGENDRHWIDIIKPECITWTGYKFSENIKDGETSDLRFLGHDLTAGARVILKIENKKVKLYIDKNMIFQTRYTNPIGKVMGVKLSFSGIGQFKDFQLKDLKTGQTF